MTYDLKFALEAHFGHSAFRPYQEEIIRQVLDGRDTLGVLPTGAGKSLCYQLPAMLQSRPTVVISPLIALMQDQLDGLPPAIYPQATLINSSLEYAEVKRRIAGIEAGEYRLIYIAPERLRQQEFLRLLQRVSPSLVVVDEAHCVSVWGHDFRPDYLFIRKAMEMLDEGGAPPVLLALTATATAEMQAEIAEQLGRTLAPITGSVYRSNLRLEVFPCANADAKMRRLVTLCKETTGAGVVYANSRDGCEQLAALLKKNGVQASFYHAGLDRETRRATQESFMLGKTRVMVATVAFGMGVDKSNVRFVVHYSLPQSLEAYTQEAGRAGRDGKPSRCALLIAPGDKANLNRWMRQNQVALPEVRDTYRALKTRIGRGIGFVLPDELQAEVFAGETPDPKLATKLRVAISMLERCGLVKRHLESGHAFQIEIPSAPPEARARLDALLEARRAHEDRRTADILGYAEGTTCRHVAIARHFDQQLEPCGSSCDRCRGTAVNRAAPRPQAPSAAQAPDVGRILLECVESLPYPLGRTGIAKVVTGAADSRIDADRCDHHGRLAGYSLKAVRAFLDDLITNGLLHQEADTDYPLVHLTPEGRAAINDTPVVRATATSATALPNATRRPSKKDETKDETKDKQKDETRDDAKAQEPEAFVVDEAEEERFEKLRAWRRIEADRQKVAPYFILQEASLRAIAQANPAELETLALVPGVGPRKLESYGAAILELLGADKATD